MHKDGWYGVDLDGTLARYDGWKGPDHIGEPIPAMVERVKEWLTEGRDVRIVTARASGHGEELTRNLTAIYAWCSRVFGRFLPVTNVKDYAMIELWDDRARQVEFNTGRLIGDYERAAYDPNWRDNAEV